MKKCGVRFVMNAALLLNSTKRHRLQLAPIYFFFTWVAIEKEAAYRSGLSLDFILIRANPRLYAAHPFLSSHCILVSRGVCVYVNFASGNLGLYRA